MRSSYIENNYGYVLASMVMVHRPITLVECGVLDGYSTVHIARALKFNHHERGIHSKLYAYDKWEKYEYSHGDINKVYELLARNNVEEYVELCYGDAFECHKSFNDGSVDFLHFDISNDGKKFGAMMHCWGDKISEGGIIAFEGGSKERDNIEWMKIYNKEPIRPAILEYVDYNWSVTVLPKFPSMTIIFKDTMDGKNKEDFE
jgi:predicted O-methyltransferase YrrM